MSGNGEEEVASGGAAEGEGAPRYNTERTCYNCGETGHIARFCKNPRVEGENRAKISKERFRALRCFNCGKKGHISAECTKPAGNKCCYNCGKEGHIARDCSYPRNEES